MFLRHDAVLKGFRGATNVLPNTLMSDFIGRQAQASDVRYWICLLTRFSSILFILL